MYNPVSIEDWILWRWLPTLVALLGIAFSLAGWSYLVLERRERVQRMAGQVAADSRRTAEASLRSHIAALQNLAGFWAVVGQRPIEEWRVNAEMLIDSYPNLAYIAWIFPDGHRARVAAGRFESTEGLLIEPAESVKLGDQPRIIGPERNEQGEFGLRLLLPVRDHDSDLGVLEARINVESLLGRVLQESAPGYAIRVFWDEEQVFARGETTSDPWQQWWEKEGRVKLPFDVSWTMLHRPTPELAQERLTPDLHYLLATGILLAITLGFLSHQLRLSYMRARFLAAGNEALEASAGELRKLNEALEDRVRERTQELEAFTHSISHDLKSPLGAILNFTSILELDYRDHLDDDGRKMLGRIRSSAVRGTELLEGLLRLSRAGHADILITRIDMEELARESFAQARQSDVDPDVEFVLDSLPPARGDRTLIREVLVNLFDNALKYSRGRENRRVTVRGRLESGECVYEVEDNGQGFDMRYASKLFRLFERLHTSRDIEGTGVGLAMVARIVTRHGGRIWAEGRPNVGARFVFTLPWSELPR